MKTLLRTSFLLMLAAVLILPLITVTSEPVGAWATCPTIRCPQSLEEYTYVESCVQVQGWSLGWAYEKDGETCYVSAESGNF